MVGARRHRILPHIAKQQMKPVDARRMGPDMVDAPPARLTPLHGNQGSDGGIRRCFQAIRRRNQCAGGEVQVKSSHVTSRQARKATQRKESGRDRTLSPVNEPRDSQGAEGSLLMLVTVPSMTPVRVRSKVTCSPCRIFERSTPGAAKVISIGGHS